MTNKSLLHQCKHPKRPAMWRLCPANRSATISKARHRQQLTNTSLTSFFWRDTLPGQAVRLDKIVTGTYNVPGTKVVYKTNLSGGTCAPWRTT